MEVRSNLKSRGSHLQHNESLAIGASLSAPLSFAKLLPQPFQTNHGTGTAASSSRG